MRTSCLIRPPHGSSGLEFTQAGMVQDKRRHVTLNAGGFEWQNPGAYTNKSL